jgi:hypothetical protein
MASDPGISPVFFPWQMVESGFARYISAEAERRQAIHRIYLGPTLVSWRFYELST